MVICRKFFHVFIVGCYIPVAPLARDFGVSIHLKNSIALAIRSLDPTRTIALVIHSFDPTRLSPSLSAQLIAIHSLDRYSLV